MPKELILSKIAKLKADLALLQQSINNSNEQASELTNAAIERWFTKIVQYLIDINQHVLKELGHKPQATYQDSFLEMAKANVLTNQLATSIAPATATRNILIHEYDELDSDLFSQSIDKLIKLVPQYIDQLQKSLDL